MSSIELVRPQGILKNKRQVIPRGRYVRREDIPQHYLQQMYEIYAQYYANTRISYFFRRF